MAVAALVALMGLHAWNDDDIGNVPVGPSANAHHGIVGVVGALPAGGSRTTGAGSSAIEDRNQKS
jgi:hypothetical protein